MNLMTYKDPIDHRKRESENYQYRNRIHNQYSFLLSQMCDLSLKAVEN